MLKRIVSIGQSDQLQKAEAAVASDDVQVVSTDVLPGFSDALLGAADPADAAAAALTLVKQHESILFLLAEAIDCRESFKPESSRRVVEHTTRFAQALGLSQDEQITLERGALLRDIGKLKISNAFLLKDGLFTYDEWSLIQAHTTIGGDLIKNLDGFQDIEDIVRRHHETWDGDGYPDKMEKEAIPFAARVVKIVDVYCAMTSPRPYREGVATKEQAMDHLKSEQGKHFDPELVDLFLDKDLGGEAIEA